MPRGEEFETGFDALPSPGSHVGEEAGEEDQEGRAIAHRDLVDHFPAAGPSTEGKIVFPEEGGDLGDDVLVRHDDGEGRGEGGGGSAIALVRPSIDGEGAFTFDETGESSDLDFRERRESHKKRGG